MASPAEEGSTAADIKNQRLLVQLRWIALSGQIATILFVEFVLRIDLPLVLMGVALLALLALNLFSLFWLRRKRPLNPALMLFFDMLLLTVQLALSGGGENPFTALYLLQITLAAVLLEPKSCWKFVGLTALLYGVLTFVHLPLRLPDYEPFFATYLAGMLVALMIDSVLIVIFVTRINRNLRNRDARLAEMRQHAIEEDHIVRMGLMASGAAHELGTPLASIAVILSDWRSLPTTRDDPELQHDIAQIQKALDRSKHIVGDILASSGEAQGQGPSLSSVNELLETTVAGWSASRGNPPLHYDNRFGADMAILSDTSIRQLITTVLDNAFEVSPGWVGLTAKRQENMLVIQIRDRGAGFDPGVLAKFGKPYNSTKPGVGKGVGLFLVANAIDKLGGEVNAANHADGGAVVTIKLPLDRLSVARTKTDDTGLAHIDRRR